MKQFFKLLFVGIGNAFHYQRYAAVTIFIVGTNSFHANEIINQELKIASSMYHRRFKAQRAASFKKRDQKGRFIKGGYQN